MAVAMHLFWFTVPLDSTKCCPRLRGATPESGGYWRAEGGAGEQCANALRDGSRVPDGYGYTHDLTGVCVGENVCLGYELYIFLLG
jgi:hypothetical protein